VLVRQAQIGHNPSSSSATSTGCAVRAGWLLRRLLKNWFSARLLKKVQIQGATWSDGYPPQVGAGVRGPYVAAPRERRNAV